MLSVGALQNAIANGQPRRSSDNGRTTDQVLVAQWNNVCTPMRASCDAGLLWGQTKTNCARLGHPSACSGASRTLGAYEDSFLLYDPNELRAAAAEKRRPDARRKSKPMFTSTSTSSSHM
mmetsp:Transcript_4421/g.15828  ORF Transcript_4421/g.15828 Transcript_4421/m.15828 type:complete len:120 (-) Transcript_4421:558-917(-)